MDLAKKLEKKLAVASVRAGTLSDALLSGTGGQSRGLQNFIAEIRNAKSKDEERKRVDKELANIRGKFTSTANLTSYQKKKYVWKMCYISLLGYDVNFGHMECISLVSSSKFQEKSVGYMSVALLLRPNDDLMMMAINSMRNDLTGNYDYGKTLALSAIANIGGVDFAETLSSEVQKVVIPMISDDPRKDAGFVHSQEMPQWFAAILIRAAICKKGILCVLRLFRANRDCIDVPDWIPRFIVLLEDLHELGIVNSVLSLMLGFASHQPSSVVCLIPAVVALVHKLAVKRTCPSDYLYYSVPCPWVQVKCLRFLQYYRVRDYDYESLEMLFETLRKLLSRDKPSEIANKNNANHSILFEAINLVIAFGNDAPEDLFDHVMDHLGRFVGVKDANIRYLSLDAMTRMTRTDIRGPLRAQPYQSLVMDSVRDGDISVKKRALDLIFALVDENNAEVLVGELVVSLVSAQTAIKEEMVIKIAILAERFSAQTSWYVDTLVRCILVAGDYVPEPVWHRVVMIVVNNNEVHEYAAEKMLQSVQNKFCHETAVALAGYLLGEVGVNICEKPGMSGYDQFAALHQHFIHVGIKTQAILLTAYAKLVNLYPDTQDMINDVFTKCSSSSHLELQQRACEYLSLPSVGQEIMENVLNSMPPFTDKTNTLLTLNDTEADTTDRSVWAKNREDDRSSIEEVSVVHSKAVLPDYKVSGDQVTTITGATATAMDLLSLDDDDVDGLPAPPVMQSSGTGSIVTAEEHHSTFSSSSSSSSSSSVLGISSENLMAVQRWHDAAVLLIGKPAEPGENVALRRAVLYEDDSISLNYAAEFRAHQGRVAVFLTNKGAVGWTDIHCHLPSLDHLAIKSQAPPTTCARGEEVRLQLMVECLRPYETSPILQISFSSSTQHSYSLRLPITPATFFEPVNTDKGTYMTRWKVLEGENTEVQEIFPASSPISPDTMHWIKSTVFPSLHIGIASELDTVTTCTGCCSFRTGTLNAEGVPIAVGAMLRLEGDFVQQRYRLTVRAKHKILSVAIMNLLKQILK